MAQIIIDTTFDPSIDGAEDGLITLCVEGFKIAFDADVSRQLRGELADAEEALALSRHAGAGLLHMRTKGAA